MSNYAATVVRISNLRPHTNADRLICTNIFGNNVIVGKDTKVGDIGLFFPLESQIGKEFAELNDLIRRKDENGKPTGGMFNENRRVRAQQFRGEKSMGFWIPIESLDKFDTIVSSDYKEGDEIEDIKGIHISKKYIPRHSQTNGSGKPKQGKQARESKIIPGQFHFHFDTAQLGKNIHKVQATDIIVLTWKLHGTSAIVSNCLVKRNLSWFEKLLLKLGINIDTKCYEYIYASRRVIKNEFAEAKQHYYGSDIWSDIGDTFFGEKLHTGETIYYEIVGFTRDGSWIQKDFDYGCDPLGLNKPQQKVFIYRITQTAADGTITELQWNQVKERAKELDLPTVPEIFYGKAEDLYNTDDGHFVIDVAQIAEGWDLEKVAQKIKDLGIIFKKTEKDIKVIERTTLHWHENFLQYLLMRYVYDQDSQFCENKVAEEGIVLRKEGSKIENFKLKSFRFLQHETGQLDKGEMNIEDNDGNYEEKE